MSIKPLPEDVIRRISSSATITSLNGVVCGLVKNSFDASATRINATVDYSRGSCTVEDDGLGILPVEFRDNGGLGKLYHTSRNSPEFECHGTNGNFLASLAALSLLSVTSHHHLHNSQNSLTIHNSKDLVRDVPASPEKCFLTFSHGTRVVVRDLFGSMAVRVKQRAVASEKAAVDKEWGRLVHHLTALLLAWPMPVALVIRDTINNNETRFRPSAASTTRGKTDLLCRSSRILAQSGLVDGLDQVSWIPVGASVGKLTIDGCISLNPVATRRTQFISLGIHPVANDHGTHVLYSEVNRVFINSAFAIEEDASTSRDQDGMLPNSRETTDRATRPKRGLSRWPMFFFNISSSSRAWHAAISPFEDLQEDRSRTLADAVDLLKVICYEFLKKHHFRPRKITTSLPDSLNRKRKIEGVESDSTESEGKQLKITPRVSSRSNSATPISRPDSPFDLWRRIKVGRVSRGMVKSGSATPESTRSAWVDESDPTVAEDLVPLTVEPSLRFLDESGNVLRRPFEDLTQPSPRIESTEEPHVLSSASVADGFNKEKTTRLEALASSSTHQETSQPSNPDTLAQESESTASDLSSAFQRFKVKSIHTTDEPSDWLKGVLTKWDNAVFEPAEPPVPRLDDTPFSGAARNTDSFLGLDGAGCAHGTPTSSIMLSGRISKAALAGAQVVSQVDQKFILVKLGRDQITETRRLDRQENSLLVLIDQHAADERCRLEALMQGYFRKTDESNEIVAQTEFLEKALQFEFSTKECNLLRRYSHHLRRWGIFYRFEQPEANQWRHKSRQLSKVEVTSLPPSILERCRTEPRIIAELLRKEIWKLEEEEGNRAPRPLAFTPGSSGREIDWITNFHGCPQGILDLLNSRSCRSAIMFNDPLTKEECEAVVQRLSRCAFPFQCAHGRPSMVPLVDTRSLNIRQDAYLGTFGSQLKKSGMMK